MKQKRKFVPVLSLLLSGFGHAHREGWGVVAVGGSTPREASASSMSTQNQTAALRAALATREQRIVFEQLVSLGITPGGFSALGCRPPGSTKSKGRKRTSNLREADRPRAHTLPMEPTVLDLRFLQLSRMRSA